MRFAGSRSSRCKGCKGLLFPTDKRQKHCTGSAACRVRAFYARTGKDFHKPTPHARRHCKGRHKTGLGRCTSTFVPKHGNQTLCKRCRGVPKHNRHTRRPPHKPRPAPSSIAAPLVAKTPHRVQRARAKPPTTKIR